MSMLPQQKKLAKSCLASIKKSTRTHRVPILLKTPTASCKHGRLCVAESPSSLSSEAISIQPSFRHCCKRFHPATPTHLVLALSHRCHVCAPKGHQVLKTSLETQLPPHLSRSLTLNASHA